MTEGENNREAWKIYNRLRETKAITEEEHRILIRAYNNSRVEYGRWIQEGEDYICSKCGHPAVTCIATNGTLYKGVTDYCPDCGAYLVEDEE